MAPILKRPPDIIAAVDYEELGLYQNNPKFTAYIWEQHRFIKGFSQGKWGNIDLLGKKDFNYIVTDDK